jgi:DNA-binding SARP family transcriptional activator
MYDAQKNRALLITCYKKFKQRLLKEMGVEPQSETEKLYKTLLG